MSGDGIKYGKTTRLTVGQFIVALFDKQHEAKLSDEELVNVMRVEFPSSGTDYRRFVSQYRNKYNRGEWSCQNEAPKKPISRYSGGKEVGHGRGPEPRLPGEPAKRRSEEDSAGGVVDLD